MMTPVRGTDAPLLPYAKWKNNGSTIVGGNGMGDTCNSLNTPFGLYIDNVETVYAADSKNHRVIAFFSQPPSCKVVAGGHGPGKELNQLNQPTDVIMDRSTSMLVICDRFNLRVVRWPHLDGSRGDVLLSAIECFGLTMDDRGSLYVSNSDKNEVRRFKSGKQQGEIVAGGNGI
ncbi:unnamed protein product, partial [Rotaria magnacalcarata]